ncbi:MAG: hypothetical protein AAF633_23790 [Chloroflexota bacterium]
MKIENVSEKSLAIERLLFENNLDPKPENEESNGSEDNETGAASIDRGVDDEEDDPLAPIDDGDIKPPGTHGGP